MKKIVFTLILCCTAFIANAQKAEQMQNSYNFKRAMELIQNDGDPNEILGYLRQEIEEHPKNGYAYYLIGMLYYDNDMLGDALEPTNKAISLLHKDKEWITYAYRQKAKIDLALNNESAALADWELSLKANPKDVNTYSDRAEFYYQKNMYAQSDADFDKICSLEPASTLGYMGKGRNALENQQYKEATELFTQAIRLDPSFSQSYAFRSEALMNQGYMNEGIDDIIRALSIDGNNMAYNNMLVIGEPEVNTLIAKLKVQQTKNPTVGAWSYYLGNVYEGQKSYNKAIKVYEECNKLNPSDVALSRIADCYSEMGYYDLAIENISKAMEIDPNDDSYVGMKAEMLYDMGRTKEAIEAYDIFIRNNPENWVGYNRRSFLKDNSNDVDGALEDYSTAIVLQPNFAYNYLGRGDMYVRKGNYEAAKNDYRMVIALDTIYGESNCVQYAYLGLGDTERAKAIQYAILANSASAGNYYDAACLFARMGEKETSLNFLRNSLEKGFRRFAHIHNDDDLDILEDMDGYKSLMAEYKEIYNQELASKRSNEGDATAKTEHVSEIPFSWDGGNSYVQCKINELPMRFVFDTGASDVSMSMVEATFMMKNGYLTRNDIVGSKHYSDANGNVNEGTVINLRKVQFGDLELDNVRASVVRNQKAPLLLGQSVLSRIGKIEIDNQKKVIVVRYLK